MTERVLSFRDGSIFDGNGATFLGFLALIIAFTLIDHWHPFNFDNTMDLIFVGFMWVLLLAGRHERRLKALQAELAALKSGQMTGGA